MANAFAFMANTFLGINKSIIFVKVNESITFSQNVVELPNIKNVKVISLPSALSGYTIKMCKCKSLTQIQLYKSFTGYVHATYSESVEEYTLECPFGLQNKLNELYPNGIIELDCSLGAQLIRHAYLNPLAKYSKRTNLDGLVYLAPTDLSIAHELQQTNCVSKGQWLLEAADKKYIGVTERGTVAQSIDEWIIELKLSCFEWTRIKTKDMTQEDGCQRQSIKQHFSAGKLDSWSLIEDVSYTENDDYDKNVEMVEALKSEDNWRIYAAYRALSTNIDKFNCDNIINKIY